MIHVFYRLKNNIGTCSLNFYTVNFMTTEVKKFKNYHHGLFDLPYVDYILKVVLYDIQEIVV